MLDTKLTITSSVTGPDASADAATGTTVTAAATARTKSAKRVGSAPRVAPVQSKESLAKVKPVGAPAVGANNPASPAGRAGLAAWRPQTSGSGPAEVLLAKVWTPAMNVVGFWMSEKLDGMRAYWDGAQLWTRHGNPIAAPEWFTASLPKVPLDGELFVGRGRFEETVSIVRRADMSDDWKKVSFVIFDAPALAKPFEERVAYLEETIGRGKHPYARALEHIPCKGTEHVKQALAAIEAEGGEGLMLREPGSKYVNGRSTSLLKVKSFLDDEARIIGHYAGKGKHQGKCGGYVAEMKDGTRFRVGCGLSDRERAAPAAVGSIITFRYFERTSSGAPRFPTYVGVRFDHDWDEGKSAAA